MNLKHESKLFGYFSIITSITRHRAKDYLTTITTITATINAFTSKVIAVIHRNMIKIHPEPQQNKCYK